MSCAMGTEGLAACFGRTLTGRAGEDGGVARADGDVVLVDIFSFVRERYEFRTSSNMRD